MKPIPKKRTSDEIPWYMSYDESELYFELSRQFDNAELTEVEFAEKLLEFPSYPLDNLPNPDAGVTLRVIIQPKISVSVPKSY